MKEKPIRISDVDEATLAEQLQANSQDIRKASSYRTTGSVGKDENHLEPSSIRDVSGSLNSGVKFFCQHPPRREVLDQDDNLLERYWSLKGWIHVCHRRTCRSDGNGSPLQLIPVTMETTCYDISVKHGYDPDNFYVKLHNYRQRKLIPDERPLHLQYRFLESLGYRHKGRNLFEGADHKISFFIAFHAHVPRKTNCYDAIEGELKTCGNELWSEWQTCICKIQNKCLEIHKEDSTERLTLRKDSSVRKCKKGSFSQCIKLTTRDGRSRHFAFGSELEKERWFSFVIQACNCLPTIVDLSGSDLYTLPTNILEDAKDVFSLNVKNNYLTCQSVKTLQSFSQLNVLNLSSNQFEEFPDAICLLGALTRLSLSYNNIKSIPFELCNLRNLASFDIQCNRLSSLPPSLNRLTNLSYLSLNFNSFTIIPAVLMEMKELHHLDFAGNAMMNINFDSAGKQSNVTSANFRYNNLCDDVHFPNYRLYENLTNLDVSNNNIKSLDVQHLVNLRILNCNKNQLERLHINGICMQVLKASENYLKTIEVQYAPDKLLVMDISKNQFDSLPSWLTSVDYLECFRASDNLLTDVNPNIFAKSSLRTVHLCGNRLKFLGKIAQDIALEILCVYKNILIELPSDLFQNSKKLQSLNATSNRLTSLPKRLAEESSLRELYLSNNYLPDASLCKLGGLHHLKCLHVAHNELYSLPESFLLGMPSLEHLNVSGNRITSIPTSIGLLHSLKVCRMHSNNIRQLTDFSSLSLLKELDVSFNGLENIDVSRILSPSLAVLDISSNPQFRISCGQISKQCEGRPVNLVETKHMNNDQVCSSEFWHIGFSETSGVKNKLCVAQLRMPVFSHRSFEEECLVAMFDGGHSNCMCRAAVQLLPSIIKREQKYEDTRKDFLHYSILTLHKELEQMQTNLAVSGAVCHIARALGDEAPGCAQPSFFTLRTANVGNVQVVLFRSGVPLVLTKDFSLRCGSERYCDLKHSTATRTGELSGATKLRRLLGGSYLYPSVSPEPYTQEIILEDTDEFLILANEKFWDVMTPQEVIKEIQLTCNPTSAAKKLQDLAQGYGSDENISIMIVHLYVKEASSTKTTAWVHQNYRSRKPWSSKFANDMAFSTNGYAEGSAGLSADDSLCDENCASRKITYEDDDFLDTRHFKESWRTGNRKNSRTKNSSLVPHDDCPPNLRTELCWNCQSKKSWSEDSAIELESCSSVHKLSVCEFNNEREHNSRKEDDGVTCRGVPSMLAEANYESGTFCPIVKIRDNRIATYGSAPNIGFPDGFKRSTSSSSSHNFHSFSVNKLRQNFQRLKRSFSKSKERSSIKQIFQADMLEASVDTSNRDLTNDPCHNRVNSSKFKRLDSFMCPLSDINMLITHL